MLPLQDKRVLSFETWGSGGFHAELLAMLGAEVINVEDPRQDGNPLRSMGALFLDAARTDNEGNEFCLHNKKSLVLDIREAEGMAIFHDLVKSADAVVNNFRGSLPRELGITHEQLKEHNPRVVCTHLSGYGSHGERAHWPGYDFLMQAETGWMTLTGDPGTLPTKVGVSVVDVLGSVYAALSTVSGLLRAERTGEGCDVETNLFDIALNCLAYQAMYYLNDGVVPTKQPRSAHATQAPSQIYKTADGWFYVCCLTEKFWELLCREMGHPGLLDDPRFKTNNDRMANRDTLTTLLDNIFSAHPSSYWCDKLQGKVPCAPVLQVDEALDSSYLKRSGRVFSIPYDRDDNRKEVHFIKPPISFPEIPGVEFELAPKLSEHTDALLSALGLTLEQLATLREKGLIL
jgi:succinate--hydroxymethylglutarate CoA-transferase